MIQDLDACELDEILPLSAAVQALHATQHPDRFPQTVPPEDARAFFAGRLARGATILVWREDGKAIGYALFEIEDRAGGPFRFPERIGKLDQISVAPGAQGRGIGTALIAAMRARLADAGIARWTATYWGFNAASAATMARAGAAPQVIRVDGLTRP